MGGIVSIVRQIVHPKFQRRHPRESLRNAYGYTVEDLERRVLLSLAAPVGPELQVIRDPAAPTIIPSIASDAQGNFVVVWGTSNLGGSPTYDIFGRLYDQKGHPRGPEFRVNAITAGVQEKPVVAMDADGDFIVAWQGAQTGLSVDAIYFRRFTSAGVPQGDDVRVQSLTTRQQDDPSVGMDAAGNFVITWQSYGQFGEQRYDVVAQRFDASGAPLGGIFKVNAAPYVAGIAWRPKVSVNASGQSIMVYQAASVGGGDLDIFARRYDIDGTPLTDDFRVNSFTTGDQQLPSITMNDAGSFVAAWESPDASSSGIFARRFDPAGVPLANDFRVNQFTSGEQRRPSATLDATGNLVITWDGVGAGDSSGIYLRYYDADGVVSGGDFRVNTLTAEPQHAPAVTVDEGGNFVVAWASGTIDESIAAQRFRVTDTPAVAGDLVFEDLDGDGIQDVDERGRHGVEVSLFNDAGVFVASTTTSSRGRYSFELLPGHGHFIQFTLPSSMIFSPRGAGSDDGLDSDADRVTGRTGTFALAPSQIDLRFDAGVVVPASVSGVVFNDLDRNGTRRASEPGLAGWLLFGDRDGNGLRDPDEPVATSGFAGEYTLGQLLPGMTLVTLESQAHWNIALPRAVTLAVGQHLSGIDLGNNTDVPNSVAGPAGPEFRVNTTTLGDQTGPQVAADAQGNIVVVWATDDVYAQRYSAAGQPLGPEFRVNANTPGDQRQPAVAMDADGDFIVTWHTPFVSGPTGGVRAQRFDSAGVAQGAEFKVNTFGDNNFVSGSDVDMDASGNFVIAWGRGQQGVGTASIYAQRYDAAGTPLGVEFRVNTVTADDKFGAAVALDDDGDIIIGWTSSQQDGSSFGVYARRFAADGQPQGAEFRVNTHTIDGQSEPAIGTDAAGNFIITWKGHAQPGDDEHGVYAQRYNASGEPVGGEFRVNTYTTRRQQATDVAMYPDGSFVVTWESMGQDGSEYGVYAQRYNAAAVPQGAEQRVNTGTNNRQASPTVAAMPGGSYLIAWHDARVPDDFDVYAQRFESAPQAATIGDRAFHDLNGNGAQDTGEPGVDGLAVSVFNESGAFAGSTTTSGGGLFALQILPDRPHYLQFARPAGLIFTHPDAADDAIDSDADADGRTGVFTVPGGNQDLTRDAGLVAPASVGGFVFSDRNTNGVYDRADPRLPGWIVFVDRDGDGELDPGEPTTSTDASGSYRIGALLPDLHRVTLVAQDVWTIAAPINVTAAPGEDRLDINFANHTSESAVPLAAVGGEFRVNAPTVTARDERPAVAADGQGNFVVVWQQAAGGSNPASLRGQRFNASGTPVGEELIVFATTGSPPRNPVVAMDADGDFVVAWDAAYSDGSGDGVFARRFDASGNALGEAFRVNTITNQHQRDPAVAMDAQGNFLITFTTFGPYSILGRQYASDGTPLGQEYRLDETLGFPKADSAVAMQPGGEFIVAWTSDGQDGSHHGVYARRFAAGGTALGGEFQVNTFTTQGQTTPSVAVAPDGNFVVTWISALTSPTLDIWARRYNAAGTSQGGEFRVNTHTTGDQRAPAVAMDEQGGFLVTWQSRFQWNDSQDGVLARRFTPAGEPLGSEFRVNTYTPSDQNSPAVAAASGTRFVVVWQSRLQAGSSYDIYAQRYGPAAAAPSRMVGAAASVFDRNRILGREFIDREEDELWRWKLSENPLPPTP